MRYCFVAEDFTDLSDDPLRIQAEYAKHLGLYCCCRLSDGTICDADGRQLHIANKRVMLRTTCTFMAEAIHLLQSRGANLLETASDVDKINHWDSLNLTSRPIYTVQQNDVVDLSFPPQIRAFLESVPYVFIKTREKGFSVQLSTRRLLQGDAEVMEFFRASSKQASDTLMLSEMLHIRSDSLGLQESRHFVIEGRLVNSSRTLHSAKHVVPGVLMRKAHRLVDGISLNEAFPKNYVLDVAVFEGGEGVYADILELNPISCSLAYVNNSIFSVATEDTEVIQQDTGMGVEYCYDALTHPHRYIKTRHSGARYAYASEEHYHFL